MRMQAKVLDMKAFPAIIPLGPDQTACQHVLEILLSNMQPDDEDNIEGF
jgi:hypothetical protein